MKKFHSKLSTWKANTLSFGGRLILAKAVLNNLLTYFMYIFAAPKGVIDTLEKIRRRFICSTKTQKKSINWVAWDTLTAPKKVGGVGLGSIRSLNLSLLAKWMWRLKADNFVMWA